MPEVRRVVQGKSPESLRPKRTAATAATPAPDAVQEFVGIETTNHELEYETSENIEELAKAFVAFRAVCPNVDKDKEGFNYRYATLGNIIAKSREHLEKHGLAVMQFPIAGVKSLGVITILIHKSGQFIRARFLMPIPSLSSTNVTQDAGAAITYARRYALAAVLGIASDEDTDGVPASVAVTRRKK